MYKKFTLDNKLTLVYENLPFVRSVSFGLWIGTGSRYETQQKNGISHFIEHMLFKGTETKTAKDIAMTIENVGGQINAFTGKECTCFYTKTLDEDLETSMELISDMLFRSRFDPAYIEAEKKVIGEEISMYEDYPEELVHDMLSETIWSGNSLSYPILGSHETISAIKREHLIEHIKSFYVPENSVISVAGNFDEDELIELSQKYFGDWKAHNHRKIDSSKPEFIRSMKVKRKETELIHMCLGFPGVKNGDDNMYSLLTVNNMLGEGMSSRLFQRIREELGLVYSIYSYPSTYRDVGTFVIYAASSPERYMDVISHIGDEIISMTREFLSESDIEKAKNQLKGSYIIGLDSTSGRMSSMGKSQLMLGRIKTPEEILSSIDKVSVDSVKQIIEYVFCSDRAGFSAIGDIDFDPGLMDKMK